MGEKIGARTKQLESLLRVGAAVVFQADPSHEMSPRFSTFIRGWEAGKYVILDRIQAGTERVMPVSEGQQCAVRFVHDGEACAFCSSVVDWNSWRDAGWIRVRWPEEMETVPFRKHHRVNVSLPCKLFQNGTEIGDGEVVDVSIGGCGILTSVDLHFGSQVAVTFFLPNGVQIQNAEFSVRNVRQRSHVQRFLGCEFRAGQEQAQNEIAAFVVAELRPGNGGRGKAACGILLIEDNTETRNALFARLKQSGYEAAGVSTAIEGFCRLFTSRPSLLIVSQEQKDLPGLDIVRAAKANPTFATLPIFLYGGRDEALKERALEAGAARYFPSTDAVINVCNAVVAWGARGDMRE